MPHDADQPTLVFSETSRRVGEAARTFSDHEVVASRYRIVRFIAAGGMGEVYEANDLELGVAIAIKTVRAEMASSEALERLKREIHIARRVTHPNVCRIFDICHHGHVTFVTMELLPGITLARHLRERKQLTTDDALPIVQQIAAGLDAAHRAGVIHRDLKSENVMLTGDRVVITDFGLARLTLGSEDGLVSMTRPGEIVGTAAYLAPEQCEGGGITPATDIYALGVVMFEMITGARPFAGDSLLTTVVQKLKEPPSSPRMYVPTLDARWEAAILRCLEREPADRFAAALDVVNALTGDAPVMTRARRDRRIAMVAAAILVVIAIGGGILQFRATRREMLEPAPARPTIAIPKRPSVAVLGFRNVAGRSESEWISTALAEMLTTELGAGESLRTIPGENVGRMKVELDLGETDSYGPDTVRRIRRNLGTDLIVYGSYATVGQAP
ncbi:MAG TPA: serine/threonine-protein kinase, partial [Thermoanaerobaculia bacterium]|nr:serine/threonine-protein kinase [Thermoanaerobaculia bacterium]